MEDLRNVNGSCGHKFYDSGSFLQQFNNLKTLKYFAKLLLLNEFIQNTGH